MPRYFLEVAYKGERYSGFQIQENAATIQSEIERAFHIFFKTSVELTGSSRTDAGVHALQNFFHFDWLDDFNNKHIYNLNAILPDDIVIKHALRVQSHAHARFDATSRQYQYHVYFDKNPFQQDRAWFFPFKTDRLLLDETAAYIKSESNFLSFCRQNSQVKTFICNILESRWEEQEGRLVYHVEANRFLRGMVRALVATMLQVARGNKSMDEFRRFFTEPVQSSADFSAPAKGLFLCKVNYPKGQFLSE